MKLVCEEHGRRVVSSYENHFIHKNGDGGRCSGVYARLGNKQITIMYGELFDTTVSVNTDIS